ncbi:unnamed protein product [Hermetia illucens]|uniref:Uncharacterized protein n=1 Tax=Hermetia illucens TaxID=343691 RepID=A0A7R8UIM7_HERIL|nr:unnamed protein product [Hermetia illucens]
MGANDREKVGVNVANHRDTFTVKNAYKEIIIVIINLVEFVSLGGQFFPGTESRQYGPAENELLDTSKSLKGGFTELSKEIQEEALCHVEPL